MNNAALLALEIPMSSPSQFFGPSFCGFSGVFSSWPWHECLFRRLLPPCVSDERFWALTVRIWDGVYFVHSAATCFTERLRSLTSLPSHIGMQFEQSFVLWRDAILLCVLVLESYSIPPLHATFCYTGAPCPPQQNRKCSAIWGISIKVKWHPSKCIVHRSWDIIEWLACSIFDPRLHVRIRFFLYGWKTVEIVNFCKRHN